MDFENNFPFEMLEIGMSPQTPQETSTYRGYADSRTVCRVPGCQQDKTIHTDRFFYYFPANKERLNLWRSALGIRTGYSSHVVCDLHFSPLQYKPNQSKSMSKPQLRQTAVPDRNLGQPLVKEEIPEDPPADINEVFISDNAICDQDTTTVTAPISRCRLCLQELNLQWGNIVDLFAPQQDSTHSVAQQLRLWFGMSFNESLDWPSFACLKCIETVELIKQFQKTITTSDATLQQLIVKQEGVHEPLEQYESQESNLDIANPFEETVEEEQPAQEEKPRVTSTSQRKRRQPKMQFVTDPELGFQCPTCEKWYKTRFQVNSHIKWHLPKDERPAKCDQCPKTFVDVGALKRHVERIHDVVKRHVCEVCGKAFSNRNTLWQHVDNHRRKEESKTGKVQVKKPDKCTVCGEETKKIRVHMMERHGVDCGPTEEDKQLVPCETCHKEVPKYRMGSHIWMFHKRPPIKCPICSMTFLRYAARQRHMDQHLNREYPCPHCDKVNKSVQGKLLHIKSHHPEEYKKVARKYYKPKDQ